MAETILVTSGKGGVGKSSCCVFLGYGLAEAGKKVLLIELDAGLRGLDIMLGLEDKTVYDIGDVITGRCEPIKALVESEYTEHLHLLPAPVTKWSEMESRDIVKLCRGLSSYYDYILLDTPAGIGQGFEVGLTVADKALLVVTPDPVCVRDAFRVSELLYRSEIENQRLIINRVKSHYTSLDLMPDLDAVIDGVGVQLIGVVPEDLGVLKAVSSGKMLPRNTKVVAAFENISHRLMGEYRPLAVR